MMNNNEWLPCSIAPQDGQMIIALNKQKTKATVGKFNNDLNWIYKSCRDYKEAWAYLEDVHGERFRFDFHFGWWLPIPTIGDV